MRRAIAASKLTTCSNVAKGECYREPASQLNFRYLPSSLSEYEVRLLRQIVGHSDFRLQLEDPVELVPPCTRPASLLTSISRHDKQYTMLVSCQTGREVFPAGYLHWQLASELSFKRVSCPTPPRQRDWRSHDPEIPYQQRQLLYDSRQAFPVPLPCPQQNWMNFCRKVGTVKESSRALLVL